MQTPATDFLTRVRSWQRDETGTAAGLAVALPQESTQELDSILRQVAEHGPSTFLETAARYWLIAYREQQPALTDDQRAGLDQAIGASDVRTQAQVPASRPHRNSARVTAPGRTPGYRYAVIALIVIAIVWLAVAGVSTGPGSNGNPPAQTGQQVPDQQQVPVSTTGLQQFETDWGPFTQLATSQENPSSGAPALILLNSGGYYLSRWDVATTGSGWVRDNEGRVLSRTVQGTYAVFTDADGQQWVTGTNQPFVLAGDPSVIIRIDPAGDVWTMPASHAITLRTRSRT